VYAISKRATRRDRWHYIVVMDVVGGFSDWKDTTSGQLTAAVVARDALSTSMAP